MTVDVIAAARRRTRRAVRLGLLVVVGLCAAVYPAGLYVNHRLTADPRTGATLDPTSSARAAGSVLPADVGWVRVAGVWLPTSPTAGPRQVTGGLARGFAHSPAGALLAAVHLLVRTSPETGPRVFDETIRTQVVGADAAAMRQEVALAYEQRAITGQVPYGQPLGPLPAALAAYRVTSYTATTADLTVLTTAADTSGIRRYAATDLRMVWTRGDWLLVAPTDGVWDSAVHLVDPAQTATFIPFPPR